MNHLEQATSLFSKFLGDEGSRVFALKGPWGIGKSYFVRQFLKANHPETPPFVSYVSLFGVRTIQEAREAIIGCMAPDQNAVHKPLWNFIKASKYIKPSVFGTSIQLPDLTSAAFWHIARNHKILIVLDDLERMHKELDIDQVLGLASSLTENSKVKVVLILNEDNLGSNAGVVSRFREKVIDVEFLYRPSTRELASRFLKEKNVLDTVVKCLDLSGGPNIRVIERIDKAIAAFRAKAKVQNGEWGPAIYSQIAAITWLFYVSPIPLTAISYKEACLQQYRSKKKDEEPNSDEKELAKLARSASLRLGDMSELVIDYLHQGYLSDDIFEDLFALAKEQSKLGEFDRKISEAYKPYTDNFVADVEGCTEPVIHLLEQYADSIGLEVMQRNCEFLEAFGKSTGLLWCTHVSAKAPNLDASQCDMYLSVLKDPSAIEIINQRLNTLGTNIDAFAKIKETVDHKSWHPDDAVRMVALPDEYYLNRLRNEQGDFLHVLRSFLKICASYKLSDPAYELKLKLERVMRQLGNENPATRVRLARFFEISPDKPIVHDSFID